MVRIRSFSIKPDTALERTPPFMRFTKISIRSPAPRRQETILAALPESPSSTPLISSEPSHHFFTPTVCLPKASQRLLGSAIISASRKCPLPLQTSAASRTYTTHIWNEHRFVLYPSSQYNPQFASKPYDLPTISNHEQSFSRDFELGRFRVDDVHV